MQVANFQSHCGSLIFHNFFQEPGFTNVELDREWVKTMFGIFVNTPTQKRNYNALKGRYKILYQSPILINPSTKNEYFIVIWLNEKP